LCVGRDSASTPVSKRLAPREARRSDAGASGSSAAHCGQRPPARAAPAGGSSLPTTAARCRETTSVSTPARLSAAT
jgi:hypothetical protein